MKKPSRRRQWYATRVRRKRTRRTIKSKRKRQTGICGAQIYIRAPAEFGLIATYTRTMLLRFLRTLERRTLVEGRRVYIDFTDTCKMNADGTLLFKAELGRIYHTWRARRLVKCNYPVNHVVEQVLQHLGLFKMMNCKSRMEITAEDVRYWRTASDTNVVGERTLPFVEEFQKSFPNTDSATFYGGLVEAITNCKQHAYTQKRYDSTDMPISPRWWLFQQIKDGKHTVAICDLGIGIKRSLLEGRKWTVALVDNMLAALRLVKSDASYIKAAMELGKSKTNKEHRGKGLQDVKNVIDSNGNGSMYIFSNKGIYAYSPSKEPPESLWDRTDSILGTLIMWEIPLSRGQ